MPEVWGESRSSCQGPRALGRGLRRKLVFSRQCWALLASGWLVLPLCPVEPAAGAAGADLPLAGDSGVFLSVFCPDPRAFLLLDIVLAKFTGEHAGLRSSGDRPGSGWLLEMPV